VSTIVSPTLAQKGKEKSARTILASRTFPVRPRLGDPLLQLGAVVVRRCEERRELALAPRHSADLLRDL
jgi:hypothetical protein